jgi:hypothetical protein
VNIGGNLFQKFGIFPDRVGPVRPGAAEVILRHGGEAQGSRDAFAQLSDASQAAVLRLLEWLVLIPPDDTASNLDPGSISLRVLFNDVNDLE